MPFITNDFHHLLVDDEDYYEKNPGKYKHYVVARRLLVTSQKSFTVKYLKDRFRKYGELQSTRVLKSKLEGFVTFTCDRHACLAYDWEKDKCTDKIVRVDSTWHQPDGAVRIDSEWNTYELDDEDYRLMELDDSIDETMDAEFSPPLLRLNDDTFFALFDRCDNLSLVNLSKTCKRLEKLLKNGNYYFPNHKSFDKKETDEWSLMDLENVFQLMGRYLNKLSVWFDDYTISETILGYVRIITKYCGDGNVKHLFIVMPSWNDEVWYGLRSVLMNLSSLDVAINDGYSDSFEEQITADLTELCPNLDTLILTDSFIVEKSLTRTVTSLKRFKFPFSWNELAELESFHFFYANRQLKVFECREFEFGDVALLLNLLPNIDTLRLFQPCHELSANDVLSLKNLQNLRRLTISFRSNYNNHYKGDKGQLIDSCARLNNLLELKLYFYTKGEKEPVLNLSNTFGHLERLQLNRIQLDEQAVVDLVRKSSNIKVIHVHECGVYATESLLAQLRAIMGRRSECSLFVGEKLNNKFISIHFREVKCIPWVCEHRYRI